MKIPLLNAGSSILKATLVKADDGNATASGLADWAGSVNRDCYAGPDGQEHAEEVSWKGHSQDVTMYREAVGARGAACAVWVQGSAGNRTLTMRTR